LQNYSYIDYIAISKSIRDNLVKFDIIENAINCSDHNVIHINLKVSNNCKQDGLAIDSSCVNCYKRLRWDRANLEVYYDYTRVQLQPILDSISGFHDPLLLDNFYQSLQLDSNLLPEALLDDAIDSIKSTYTLLVKALEKSGDHCIPRNGKFKAKFWWDDSMNIPKKNYMDSFKI